MINIKVIVMFLVWFSSLSCLRCEPTETSVGIIPLEIEKNDASESTQETSSTKEDTALGHVSHEEKSLHAQTITLLHPFKGPFEKPFEKLISEFNEHSSVKVVNVPFSEEKRTYEGIHGAVREGQWSVDGKKNVPFIVFDYEMGARDNQHDKQFIPVQDFIEKANKILGGKKTLNLKMITPTLRRFYSDEKGKLCAIPFNSNTLVLYGNREIIGQEKIPDNFEDFKNVALSLKKKYPDKKIFAFGWIHGHLIDQWAAIHNVALSTHHNGLSEKNKEPLKLTFKNNPFWIEWFSFVKELYDEGLIDTSSGNDAEKNFNEGRTIFLSQGTNRVPFLKIDHTKVSVDLFPTFKKNTKRYTSISGGGAFWVHRTLFDLYEKAHKKDRPEILKLIKGTRDFLLYLISSKAQNLWESETGYLSVLKNKTDIVYKDKLVEAAAHKGRESRERFAQSDLSSGIKIPHYQEIRDIQLKTFLAFLQDDKAYFEANKNYLDDKKAPEAITSKHALQIIENKGNEVLAKNTQS